MTKFYKCPVCASTVHEMYYLPGFYKCMKCCELIKRIRRVTNERISVTCLKLFYKDVVDE